MSETKPFGFKDYALELWEVNALLSRMQVDQLTSDLSDDELNWQSGPGVHSIWHHLWHMYLTIDYYTSYTFGVQPFWEEGGWASQIDLSRMKRVFDYDGILFSFLPHFTICEIPDELVDDLKAPPLVDYLTYVDAMLDRAGGLLKASSEADLRETVFAYDRWLPRIASTSFNHVNRHIGMMESVKGLIRGPGQGTATY